MGNEALTAKQVEHMKPSATRVEVPAGPPSGLYLVVQTTGKKSWMFRYRFHGRTRGLTFKESYPKMQLAAARAEAQAAVDELDNGVDPAETKQKEQQTEEQQRESVASVIEKFVDRALQPKEKERGETARILTRETKAWRNRPISDIKTPDVHDLLDAIVDRGHSVMACRTRGALLRLFAWAKGRKYIEHSPMLDVPKPGPDHKERERVLEPGELFEVWNAAATFEYPLGPFYRFLILTAQRRGEAATMKWTDVDLEKAVWTIPGENTKNGRTHHVPLSAPALAILKSLPRFKGPFVFTSGDGSKAINGFSKAKVALDAAIAERRKESRLDGEMSDWTVHDLRRTAATTMAGELKVLPHVLSAVLNHSPGTAHGITAIYNRYEYFEEKREALKAWARYVAGLRAKKPQSKKRRAS